MIARAPCRSWRLAAPTSAASSSGPGTRMAGPGSASRTCRAGFPFRRPLPAALGEAHVIDVAWGALGPAAKIRATADLSATLRNLLGIAVDGRPLLFRRQAFSLRTTHVIFGANRIGSGLCRPFLLRGGLRHGHRPGRPPAARNGGHAARESAAAAGALLPGGYPGPLRLRVSLPRGIAGQAEPLLGGGNTGVGGVALRAL